MKDKIITITACFVFLMGAVIFCYPLVMNQYYDYHTDQILDSYKEEMKRLSDKTAKDAENITDSMSGSFKETDELNHLYEEMIAYNQAIYENRQADLSDPFSYEASDFDLSAYGIFDDVLGYLTIPAMDVELPIYLGATNDNLKKGAVHLGQTSMPIGGVNTNVVLAAHRGYRGIPMFREIEKLKAGDLITVTTFWDTLTYQVDKTLIILPDETEKILIQPGEDMLTLLTCHPYRENSHRYVVYCKRISSAENEETENKTADDGNNHNPASDASEAVSSTDSTEHTITPYGQQASSSQRQINLDKYVPIAGIIFLLILFLICMVKFRKK